MQPLASAELMRRLDRITIETIGIPGVVLMENAGRSVVAELRRRYPDIAHKRVTVACGKGNNGGDGFVVARHLANLGCTVRVVLLARDKDLTPDAAIHWRSVKAMSGKGGIAVRRILTARGFAGEPKPDIVVDAIFGTGFSGTPAGVFASAIRWINRSRAFVAAVDIPSGVHGTTGRAEGDAVKADMTVALALAKTGNVVGQGYENGGAMTVGDIGMPSRVAGRGPFPAMRVEEHDVASVLPGRPLRAHKYSAGKVFILAGSRSFTGAAVLCAEAALRSGAGAVVLGIPRSIHAILAKKVTEVILLPLDETGVGTLGRGAKDEALQRCAWADAVAMGPGLGRNPETDGLVRELVGLVEKPLVLDADALTAVAAEPHILKRRGSPCVVTPHAGELARIVPALSEQIAADPIGAARAASRRLGCIVALKGAPTMVSGPRAAVMVNSTGNPGMATIGSGDVLTGLIAGLCAQGADLWTATWAGVFIHGRAGDRAAASLGQRSLLAGDILEQLPGALRSCER